MSDDRSRDERAGHQALEPGAVREPWYERLMHLLHLRSRDSVRDDIEDALAGTAEDTGFSVKERTMLKNVLKLHLVRVDDAMVPRADIVAIAADCTVRDLLGIFRKVGHSRLPVYGDTLDDPKGMVHIRDFLGFLAEQSEADAPVPNGATDAARRSFAEVDLSMRIDSAGLVRPVLFAPPSMPILELLVRMQATHTHMALVIDEYGGTDGLVTIEDVVERVVGDIEDEHDVDPTCTVQPSGDGTFVADARASLEEVSQALQLDLLSHDVADNIDTLGGLVTALAGRVPSSGDLIAGPDGLAFEVLDADPRRLKRVRILPGETGRERSLSGYQTAAFREAGALKRVPAAAPSGRDRPSE